MGLSLSKEELLSDSDKLEKASSEYHQSLGSKAKRQKLLRNKVKKVVREYYFSDTEETEQNLLQVLQNNDCREVISKCVGGVYVSSAFVLAGRRNQREIVLAFLDHGMNVDIKNEYGMTALIEACQNGHEELVPVLLDRQANVDIQSSHGYTALMWASRYGRKEIVQLLLDHNADINLKRWDGKTALDLADDDNYIKDAYIVQEIKEMIQNHVNTSYVLK